MNARKRLLAVLLTVMLLTGLISPALPSAARTTGAILTEWTLEGRVYEGEVGDESAPLEGVTVSVYGANATYPESGTFLRDTTTDAEGWYGLVVYDDDLALYDYVYIQETNPDGFISSGATTVSGTVQTDDWIE